jgi:sugar lactone lactonase YvrE
MLTGIAALAIQSNGSLVGVPGAPFAAASASGMAFSPNGKFLYLGQGANINVWTIGGNGALTAGGVVATPANGVADLTTDIAGKFLWVLGTTAPGTIATYTMDPNTGALTLTTGGLTGFPSLPTRLKVVSY